MAWGSVAVGVLAFIMMVAGFFLSWVPILGSLLSFGAPIVAIAGVVMGGVAMSRAKQAGQESGAAIAGLIVSIIAFFPAVVVALTCGMCNACATAGMMNPQNRQLRRDLFRDGGPFNYHPPPRGGFLDAGKPPGNFGGPTDPPDPNGLGANPGVQPGAGYPPPAFPPPPVPGTAPSQPGGRGSGAADPAPAPTP